VARLEEDLIDRAANPLRKRLARMLLILASLDVGRDKNGLMGRMSEQMLAKIVTGDPQCIAALLQEFRQAGHLGLGEPLTVHSSLVSVLLPAEGDAPMDHH